MHQSSDDRCCAELICNYEITNDLKWQQGCILFTLVIYVLLSLSSKLSVANASVFWV